MGARPSSFFKGGGRLNNVPGTIVAITFTDLELVYTKGQAGFTLEEFTPGKIKTQNGMQDKRQRVTAIARILVDGAKAEVEEPFEAGLAENFAISEDGQTIWDAAYETPEEAAAAEGEPGSKVRGISLSSEFGRFIDELVKAGFPETLLPERGINYEAVFGTRVQFVQRPRKDKNGNVIRKKGSDGKERDKTYTSVDEVLSLPDQAPAAPAAPAKSAAKPAAGKAAPAAKVAPATPGKVAGKAKTPPEPVFDLDATATELLLSTVAEKGTLGEDGFNTLPIAKLGGINVLSKFPKHPNRNDIAKRIVDATFLASLAENNVIVFGAAEKAARVIKVPALSEELAETVDE